MTVEFRITKNQWAGEKHPHVTYHNTVILTPKADFVKELITRWGMVQAMDNGEDSVGRHQLNLMPPADVVNRAMEMADLMYKAFEDNKMLIDIPTLAEMEKMTAEMKDTDKTEAMLDKLKARAETE